MSIIETGAKAMRSVVWTEDDWDTIGNTSRDLYRNEFRAALRSVKPSDISDEMFVAFVIAGSGEKDEDAAKRVWAEQTETQREQFRRAIAAAIAKGGE